MIMIKTQVYGELKQLNFIVVLGTDNLSLSSTFYSCAIMCH